MYKIINSTSVSHIPTGAVIQLPAQESYGFAYAEWLAAGNTPAPYEPPTVPATTRVSMRQARLALLELGYLPAVDAALDALPEPQKSAAKIEWAYSQEVDREWGIVQALAPALGLDDAALDGLFALAASK